MAEANVGSIVATLSVDARAWQQGLQQAAAQLQQFEQTIARMTGTLNQFGQAFQQAMGQNQQGLATLAPRAQQASQSFQQFNTQLNQTNQAFTHVNQTVQQFNTQITTTTTTVQQARQAMQQAQAATSNWRQILQVAAGIGLATTISGIVSSLVSFTRETVQTGARLEQLRASLSAIAGSTAAGQQQFQFLTATAQQLGVTLEPIARGWRTLTAAATQANLPLADQQRLLTALATEARRVGASNEELNRAIIAVSQSASKGKLSMEELRQQLGEALPTAFAAVARGMGRTTEELEKLIETGSVRFPAFARALTRGFEQMQASSGQMTETTQAAFNRLTNAWVLMQDTIMKSGLNTYLVTVANNLREAVEWTTRLVSGRSEAAGPTMGDLGATPEQAQEIKRLQGIIGPYSRLAETAADPAHRAQYAGMVERTREQLDQLLTVVRGTQDQAAAQARVTAEVGKTAAAREIEADFVADVTKKLGDLRKAQEDFRKEAALSPERLGRPGTPEFLQGLAKTTEPQLEALTKLVAQPPQGVMLPGALRQQLAAEDVRFGDLGRQRDALLDKERGRIRATREAEQEAERDARERRQQVEATGREQHRAIDEDIHKQGQAHEQLTRLAAAYGTTKEARDRDTASILAAQFPQNETIQQAAQLVITLSEEAEATRESFTAIKQRTDALREASDAQQTFQNKLDQAEARLRAPREERQEVTLRGEAAAQGIALTADQERQLQGLTRLRQEQARLTQAAEIWRDVSFGIGSAWSQALQSIADHTKTVSEAFRAMGQAILQTFADIAAQQATQAFFKLGMGILTSALTGGAGAGLGGESASAVGAGINPIMFQHGGMVNRPTLAMLGESAAHNPEVVLNRQQMQSLFGGGGTGGQGTNVIVNNFPSRQAAEEDAARQRSQGHQVIVNEILSELSTGESSRINRALRALQR